MFIIVIYSWWIDHLSLLLLPLVTFLHFKSILFVISIDTPAILWLLFEWYNILHPFTFHLFVFLNLNSISCRHHIVEYCFFLSSLLTSTFWLYCLILSYLMLLFMYLDLCLPFYFFFIGLMSVSVVYCFFFCISWI